MAFSFNKLFPRIPPLPLKAGFIKVKYTNQALDLLNISNIFRDHRVTSKISQYFENIDPPFICYQYKRKRERDLAHSYEKSHYTFKKSKKQRDNTKSHQNFN